MTLVVRDAQGILHAVLILPFHENGGPVLVARCKVVAYAVEGEDVRKWGMDDASEGDTDCMACVASEAA